ncbi:hypothetical protein FKM82_012406 [Ascaphus truei]
MNRISGKESLTLYPLRFLLLYIDVLSLSSPCQGQAVVPKNSFSIEAILSWPPPMSPAHAYSTCRLDSRALPWSPLAPQHLAPSCAHFHLPRHSMSPQGSDTAYRVEVGLRAISPVLPCKGSKRYRTIFTQEQLQRLEEEFVHRKYMVGCQRVQLASELQLSETQVKVWFQNRRMKWRKEVQASEDCDPAKDQGPSEEKGEVISVDEEDCWSQ